MLFARPTTSRNKSGFQSKILKSLIFLEAQKRGKFIIFPFIKCLCLNNLKVLCADVSNAYLNAECAERVCFKAGPEFGQDEGKWIIIRRALYGLKSSANAWRSHLARVLEHDLNFVPCKADRDVWMREAERQDGSGAKYYEYISTYVDDVQHVTSE